MPAFFRRATTTTANPLPHHHARTFGRAVAVIAAAFALLCLTALTTADQAAAQFGGFSRGGGGGMGFGRGSFGGGRSTMGGGGRGMRMQSPSGSRYGGGGMRNPGGMGRASSGGAGRVGRAPGGNAGRVGRSPGATTRAGRDGRSARPGSRTTDRRTAGDRRGNRDAAKREASRKNESRNAGKKKTDSKQPSRHVRSTSYAGGKTHARSASAGKNSDGRATADGTGHRRTASNGNSHYRSASAGGSHDRRASAGGGLQRTASSGNTHYRSASAGGSHDRRMSAGGGHQRTASHDRRASYGGGGEGHYRRASHDRRFSMGRVPPYTPPVPPVVIYDPPAGPPAPPTPPSAGGGGGGSQPPRAAPPSSGQPPVRVSRAFGGVPPSGEDRYVPDEVICVLRDDLTEGEIDQFLADNQLERTPNGRIHMGLIGVQVFRYRITDGRSVPQAIAGLQNDARAISIQPNYIYQMSDSSVRAEPVTPMVRTASGLAKPSSYTSMQYIVGKLRLRQAHQFSRGERVLIAVIDSGVDVDHPEIAGSVIQQIDVTDAGETGPHSHGTAMTGIIVSQSQLMGVAPAARVIAIRVFAPRAKVGTHGTSFHIAMAIDRAAQEGARIINLSLAGPNDPYVHKAVKEARARGIVLVAAAGNAGPTSPPLYPAAYTEVIAVTATDRQDRLYARANRGPHILVAAPGVEVLVAMPRGAYGVDSGTSVATAHVSGIVALMLARNPMLDPDAVRELLVRSVRAPGADSPQDDYGAGHVDAYEAVAASGPPEAGPPVAAGPRPTPAQYSPNQ